MTAAMKMILSSRDFHEEAPKKVIRENLPKSPEDCKVLFIPGENATAENLRHDMYNRRMRQKGFGRQNIYVFDHTRPEDFVSLPLDVIYVGGCNTFLLMQKLRDTGFDAALIRYIRSGVTYIGGSAGAHIVGKSLSHLTRYDLLPDGFADFPALGLFDGIFICHYGPERDAHYRELLSLGENVIALSNEQSLVVTEEGSTLC